MNKALLVARHEYVETVRTKAFWLGLLAFPIIIALAIAVPMLMEKTKEARTYAVIDPSGFLNEEVETRIYLRDLQDIVAHTSRKKRQADGEYDRLPQLLRELNATYLSMEEDRRPAFVEALAGTGTNLMEARTAWDGKAAQFLAEDGPKLRTWWEQTSTEEMERLDLELVRSTYRRVQVSGTGAELLAELNRRIANGSLFAYLVINDDPITDSDGCKYVSNNLTDQDLRKWYSGLATEVVGHRRVQQQGLDPEVARWVHEPVNFVDRKVDERGAVEEVDARDTARQWAPVAFTYLLWIAIFTSAQMLLTSTIEEKSARIIEVLLSSVSAFELMAGKIAGMAAAGLTVVASWGAFIIAVVVIVPLATGNPQALGMLQDVAADPLYLLSFIIYFLFGYLYYAAILVGIGSVCNSLKDAQNLMMPVIIPMMVAIFALIPISRDPNGTFAQVMSFIPPFTPFVMMNRAAGPPALWEYLATGLLMLAAIYAAVWAAARIFRIGVLMTGKPPSIRQMIRWLAMDSGGMPPMEPEGGETP